MGEFWLRGKIAHYGRGTFRTVDADLALVAVKDVLASLDEARRIIRETCGDGSP